MNYRVRIPGPPLGDFVNRIWLCTDTSMSDPERIVPSGTVELVVNLAEDNIRIYQPSEQERSTDYSGSVVAGTYTRCFVIKPYPHISMRRAIGVNFRPGGAYPFFGAPTAELADAHIDLENLWGRTGSELRERLCRASTDDDRFAILEHALTLRLRQSTDRNPVIGQALEFIHAANDELKLADLVGRIGRSQRWFIQTFKSDVGLCPKMYQRICRFQRARRTILSEAKPDWGHIAVECGYYDQSHLIHDFRQFSGFAPTEYLRQSSKVVLPNHILHSV